MIGSITKETLDSVKRSYFNMLALFLANEKIESRFMICFLKWGFQLRLNPDDVSKHGIELENIQFSVPEEKLDKLEAIYHLVYMIQLDKVVEDSELEIATIFAQRLGFQLQLWLDYSSQFLLLPMMMMSRETLARK